MTDNRTQVFDVAMKNARLRRPTVHDGRRPRTEIGSSTAHPSDLPVAPSAKQSSEGVGATTE